MSKLGRLLVSTALVSLAAVSAASAGGFQRGTADTDVLFESDTVTFRSGLTYVSPQRGFTSINGVGGDYSDYTGTYNIPSIALGFGGGLFACAATYTESFAAEADYTSSPGGALPSQNALATNNSTAERLRLTSGVTSRTRNLGFDSDEFGATCRASYQSDMGRFSLLGGVFFEDFDFEGSSFGARVINPVLGQTAQGRTLLAGLGAVVPGGQVILPTQADVRLRGDYKTGYRFGAAYEMPEIALRVQGIYRSEIEHDDVVGGGTVSLGGTAFVSLNGQQVSVPVPTLAAGVVGAGNLVAAQAGLPASVAATLNTAISPQSFTINAQTGIAEGTLLLGSFRWTDWSTNDIVVTTLTTPTLGTTSSYAPYYWRDGYTASLGLGRAFTENVSGAISVGYDRGVSTGAETTYTDLYTLSGGFSVKDNKLGELRVGGLIGYWTDGSQSISENSYYNATVDEDWVYGANASLKFSF